ncbi:MAG: hypothetical protein OQK69_04245 [Gammaproteobacteria bacterium]|nr:hypothetical protein [Gammaproteobacteria bacterium]
MKILVYVLFINCFIVTSSVRADDEVEQSSDDGGFPVPHQSYLIVADFAAEEVPGELDNPRADYGLGVGIAYEHLDYFDMRYELLVIDSRYNTPASVSGGIFTNVSDDMSILSLGLSVIPILKYAVSNVELYAGAGISLFWSTLTISASTLGIPGTHEEKSSDVGYQTLAGISYRFVDSAIAIEFRQLDFQVNLSPVTSTGNLDAGGDMVSFIYKFIF